jgi:hypothetical protein
MVSTPTLINGLTGPYTGQVGGYGKNTAHNQKQFLSQPTPPKPSFGPDKMKDLGEIFTGGGNPESIIKILQGMMKDMAPTAPELPNIQYTEASNVGTPALYDDVLAYSKDILQEPAPAAATPTGPGGIPMPKMPSMPDKKEMVAKFTQARDFIKNALPLASMFLPSLKGVEAKLKPILDADPEKAIEDLMSGKAFGPLPTGLPDFSVAANPKNQGLAKELLDRNKDGKVDEAEKAAETLLLDDSVNLLKAQIGSKLADSSFVGDDANYDKAMAFSTLNATLDGQISAFDGTITVQERAWGVKAGENKETAELVGNILDTLLVTHDLRSKVAANAFDDLNEI